MKRAEGCDGGAEEVMGGGGAAGREMKNQQEKELGKLKRKLERKMKELEKQQKERLKVEEESGVYTKFKIILKKIFEVNIEDEEFNPEQNRYIPLQREVKEGNKKNKARDIVMEGSGILQWIAVLAYALYEDVDVLLLDEPDCHMHGDLQKDLFNELHKICKEKGKQIILNTHSVRIIQECAKHWKEDEVNAASVVVDWDTDTRTLEYCKNGEEVEDKLLRVR